MEDSFRFHPKKPNKLIKWERPVVQKLIKLLFEHRNIWDTEMPEYKCKNELNKSLNAIRRKLQPDIKNITTEDIRYKFILLVHQVRKQLLKLNGSHVRHKFWAFKSLEFLRPFMKTYFNDGKRRKLRMATSSTDNSDEEDNDSQEDVEDDENEEDDEDVEDVENDEDEYDSLDYYFNDNLVQWDRRSIQKLIKLLFEHRCLWDTKMPEYKHRQHRIRSLCAISRALQYDLKHVSKEDVRNKIACLKNQFRKQLRQIEASDIKKPSLWCFNSLKFLRPFMENGADNNKGIQIRNETISQDSYDEDDNDCQEDYLVNKMWDRQNTEKLINLFREQKWLWDPETAKTLKYGHRIKREAALNAIYEQLHPEMENVTVDEIKRKIFSIRSQFRKEIRKIEASFRNSDNAADRRVSTLWCFDLLEFLIPSFDLRVDAIKADRIAPQQDSDADVDLDTKQHSDNPSSFHDDDEDLSKPYIHGTDPKLVNWDRKSIIKLINLFHGQRCLWDPKMSDYQYKTHRQKALNFICEKLRNDIKNITPHQVRKKIFSLRSQYRKQIRQLKLSKRGGEIKKPSLWCFNLLKFLRPVTGVRMEVAKDQDATVQPDESEEEESDTKDDDDPLSSLERELECLTSPSFEEEFVEIETHDQLEMLPHTESLVEIERHIERVTPPIQEEVHEDINEEIQAEINEELIEIQRQAQCESPIPPTQEELFGETTPNSPSIKNKKIKKENLEIEEHLQDLKVLLKQPKRKFDFLAEQVSATLEDIDDEEITDCTVGAIQRLLLESKAKYRRAKQRKGH